MTEQEIQHIVEDVNHIRKKCDKEWYNYKYVPLNLKIKGFGTWIQSIEIDDTKDSSPMGMTVKEFKEWLTNWLKGINNYATT